MRVDVAVVGGGIVGLAVAAAIGERHPGASVAVLEKEDRWAAHQTGRNSGVIHAGVSYRPGSLKARLCRAGNRSMVQLCREHGIPHEVCGKVVVATGADELAPLAAVAERARRNGVDVRALGPEELAEREPHVAGVAALLVPATGIVDFAAVCRVLARVVASRGGDLRLGTEVVGLRARPGGHVVETTGEDLEAGFVVGCAGLQGDRLARLGGVDPGARIVPFRGEYHELRPERRHLVRHLVYPVPDPTFPFLGVHLTRGIDGGVHAGPNAVLALAREGYRWRDLDLRDAVGTLGFPGFWRLARRHHVAGRQEVVRSLHKAALVRSLQRLVPEVTADDLVPSPAGVRAQALRRDGSLVDDFLLVDGPRALHVCNAPSPAATASLEIAFAVVDRLPDVEGLRARWPGPPPR